jgi:hypothetical protein
MSFGGGGSQGGQTQSLAALVPAYTGLQLMTSAESLPRPIIYGLAPLAPNIIYYNNFQSHPVLAWTGQTWIITSWYYTADLAFALCEGQIANIGQVWQNNSTYLFHSGSPNPEGWSLSVWQSENNGKGPAGALSLFTGASGQMPWSYLAGTGYDLAYKGLAYIGAAGFNLGSSAAVGSLRFEIAGPFYGSGANGIDADPALVIQDFLTNPSYGVPSFMSGSLDASTLLGASGDSSCQSYWQALGLCFSPALVQQETAASILTRWCKLLNVAPVWTGGKLKFVPYGDLSIHGVLVNWTAQVTPVYVLTYDHFMAPSGGDMTGAQGSPVVVERNDPLALFNVQRLEAQNRAGVNVDAGLVTSQISANFVQALTIAAKGVSPGSITLPQPNGQPQYQATPIEARDLYDAEINGLRLAPTMTAHEICDLSVAATVAQILLQRGLYIRNTFRFTVSWEFSLLDPMDVVSITDPLLGLSAKTVRILEIEENDDGSFVVIAEDLTIGVSTPGPNIVSGSAPQTIDVTVTADPVDLSLVYEPPAAASNGVAQIWFGASGGSGGVPDPNWGGCNVWVSIDGGSTYTQIGVVARAAPMGSLTASYPSASGFDTTDTLSVNLAASGGELASTTAANAQAGAVNLSLIDSELVAFETATLTGANAYNLTNVQRGAFGTTPAAHSSGAQFAQLSNILQYNLPAAWVGVWLYFKFQSFNVYNNGLQSLSACTPVPYTPRGAGYGASQINTLSETVALSGASTLTTTAKVPAGAYLLEVSVTIATPVTGPSSINIDPQYLASGAAGGSSGAFGSVGVSTGANHNYSTGGFIWGVASEIVLTGVGGSFASGSATVSVTYLVV